MRGREAFIQALERAQGYLKLPNGRALTGQSHDYKRHGTTTLFAALEVATGKIIATHSKRRRRVEFLDFMNSVTAAFPGRKLHVILDNLNTHKKNEPWLKAHPNVQFHFTPTSASWLNQVEVWFSILQGQSAFRKRRCPRGVWWWRCGGEAVGGKRGENRLRNEPSGEGLLWRLENLSRAAPAAENTPTLVSKRRI